MSNKAFINILLTPHKEKIINELKKLKSDVSTKDRKDAAKTLDMAYNTIGNYLNGICQDVDTGVQLIQFFRSCIHQRELILSN